MARDVLIVDDSAVIRRMMRKTMEMAGLDFGEVFEASNGIEALACLADHPVAVMMVDINMPTMNGIQLLERIKKNDKLKDIPVVIASTEGSKQRIDDLMAIGAYGYVRKPFQPEQLRELLTPILGTRDEAEPEHACAEGDAF